MKTGAYKPKIGCKIVRVTNAYEKNMIFMDVRDLRPGVYLVTLTFPSGSYKPKILNNLSIPSLNYVKISHFVHV